MHGGGRGVSPFPFYTCLPPSSPQSYILSLRPAPGKLSVIHTLV